MQRKPEDAEEADRAAILISLFRDRRMGWLESSADRLFDPLPPMLTTHKSGRHHSWCGSPGQPISSGDGISANDGTVFHWSKRQINAASNLLLAGFLCFVQSRACMCSSILAAYWQRIGSASAANLHKICMQALCFSPWASTGRGGSAQRANVRYPFPDSKPFRPHPRSPRPKKQEQKHADDQCGVWAVTGIFVPVVVK